MNEGIDPAKVRAVAQWRQSDLFDDRERAVLAYAEAATACPAAVTDAVAADIRAHLNDAEFVELAAWVALENYRSRFNAGLGLRSEGFSDSCEIPMRDHGGDAAPDAAA
jgi:alkylhydroperoxidase family enzyme